MFVGRVSESFGGETRVGNSATFLAGGVATRTAGLVAGKHD